MSKREDYTVSWNAYEALGFPDHAEMQVKARLAMQISDLIKSKNLNQTQAAKQVGLSQPKLSGLLRGQFRGISQAKMMGCLAALGNDVEIVVRAAAQSTGQIQVSIRGSALDRRRSRLVTATSASGHAAESIPVRSRSVSCAEA